MTYKLHHMTLSETWNHWIFVTVGNGLDPFIHDAVELWDQIYKDKFINEAFAVIYSSWTSYLLI